MKSDPAVPGGLRLNQPSDDVGDTLQRVASQMRHVRFQQLGEGGNVRASGIRCHGDPSMPLSSFLNVPAAFHPELSGTEAQRSSQYSGQGLSVTMTHSPGLTCATC